MKDNEILLCQVCNRNLKYYEIANDSEVDYGFNCSGDHHWYLGCKDSCIVEYEIHFGSGTFFKSHREQFYTSAYTQFVKNNRAVFYMNTYIEYQNNMFDLISRLEKLIIFS